MRGSQGGKRRVASSGVVVLALAGPFVIRLGSVGGRLVLASGRGILDGPPSGMLVSVAGVLDQLVLGLFKTFRLTLAGLDQRTFRLIRRTLSRARLRTGSASDSRRLGGGAVSFFLGAIGSGHLLSVTRGHEGQTTDWLRKTSCGIWRQTSVA